MAQSKAGRWCAWAWCDALRGKVTPDTRGGGRRWRLPPGAEVALDQICIAYWAPVGRVFSYRKVCTLESVDRVASTQQIK